MMSTPDPDVLCFEDFHMALDLPIITEHYGFDDLEHWMLCEFAAEHDSFDADFDRYRSPL